MPKPSPLQAGAKAPFFSFSEHGKEVSRDTLDGPCLLYFYPKDDTPGCTKQACGIRDAWEKFEAAGIRVVGVSKDDEASHRKFTEKYDLPFPLIADTDLELAKAFGVYGEKKFMGKTFDGIHRMSFLIATDGTILKTYPKVKPNEHAETVLGEHTQLTT
ncbi:MAG TPA: thioredoxin-dependent thiol peroxidase [Opitutales bacterium]|nr:thioredoxin-dependent thiol peroxidase [Opitutales bacterium]